MSDKCKSYYDQLEKIYAKFDNSRICGSNRPPHVPLACGIILQHTNAIAESIEMLSTVVCQTIPGTLGYQRELIHTSLCFLKRNSDSTITPNDRDYHVGPLCNCLQGLNKAILGGIRINFSKWAFNTDTLIAVGWPNDAFWHACETLSLSWQSIGNLDPSSYRLSMPQTAHITVARFKQPISKELTYKLNDMLQEIAPLGEVSPTATVAVSHSFLNNNTLELTSHEQVEI